MRPKPRPIYINSFWREILVFFVLNSHSKKLIGRRAFRNLSSLSLSSVRRMPPRKKPNPSVASSKKSLPKLTPNPNPPKYGIQHFFDRHTQTNPSSSSFASSRPLIDAATVEVKDGSAAVEPPMVRNENGAIDEGSSAAEVSPEVAKSLAVKRFKFSPGMVLSVTSCD